MVRIAPAAALRMMLVLLASWLLFGCQLLNRPADGKIVVDDLQLYSADKQDQAIDIAISRLEQGETQLAREIIDRVLRINKQHPTAQLLVKLLDQPVQKFFKTERLTNYVIKPGDTLGSIADTWLGNSLYFISLAKLNNIEQPTRIKPGNNLRIPVIESSPLVQKEIRRSNANLKLIKNLIEDKDYFQALKKINTLFILKKHTNQLTKLQQQALSGLAQSSVSISDRYSMLEKINQTVKSNPRKSLDKNYKQFVQQQTQNVLLDEFNLLLDDQSFLDSADKLIAAKSYPQKQWQDELSHRVELLIEKLHEEAIIYRKNQDFGQAMTRWEKILFIDPDNELAKKYHARTSKLLAKLEQLY